MFFRPSGELYSRLQRVKRQATTVESTCAGYGEEGGGDDTAGCLVTEVWVSECEAVQGFVEAWRGRLTVSAMETVSLREMRRVVTSLRMGRMEEGGKGDVMAEGGR